MVRWGFGEGGGEGAGGVGGSVWVVGWERRGVAPEGL